jgi:hypothetical protein
MPFHVHFSNAFHHSSTTLDPMLMQQPNSSNAQAGPYLAVLLLSELLQYRTERYGFLLHHFQTRWFDNFSPVIGCCSAEDTRTFRQTPSRYYCTRCNTCPVTTHSMVGSCRTFHPLCISAGNTNTATGAKSSTSTWPRPGSAIFVAYRTCCHLDVYDTFCSSY